MSELATITTARGSIKAAADIAKSLKESRPSLSGAELDLKLEDLVTSLVDAGMRLVEMQDAAIEKGKGISELKEALQAKDTLNRRSDSRYKVDELGKIYRYEVNVAFHEV